jgi:ABC-2 type transport system permease protein
MRRGIALVVHSLNRHRTLILTMAGILAAFQVLLCLAAETLERSNFFGPLISFIPDPMRQALGPTIVVLMSFTGIVGAGYLHIAIVAALLGMVISIGTEPAAEIENHFIDLVLAHPLARHWIVFRTILLLIVATLSVLLAMGVGSTVGIVWLAPRQAISPSLYAVRALASNLALLMLCWGGISLAFASAARRRSVPAAFSGVLALSTYLVDYLARFWSPLQRVSWLCPFHYYNAVDLIGGAGLPMRDLWVLAAIAVAGFGTALFIFNHRDL